MSKEKQIEEMAKVIARRSTAFRNQNVAFMTTATKTAESLYNADYRKATDVAEEIFKEIEKLRLKEIHKCETLREQENEVLQRKYWEGGYNSLRQLSYWLAELKKKYTLGEKGDEGK